MNMKNKLVKFSYIYFYPLNLNILSKLLLKVHTYVCFLKMLKDKTSPLKKAGKTYFSKFMHSKFAIGEDFNFKILIGCTIYE